MSTWRRPARLAKLFWPYLALWLVVTGAVAGYAWYDIESTRERELADGRVEADNLARVLQEQVARNLEGAEHTLAALKVLVERAPGAVTLAEIGDRLGLVTGTPIERRVNRFDRDGRIVDSTDPQRLSSAVSIADVAYFRRAREQGGERMVIAEPTVGRVSGLLAIPLVMRLSTRDGAFDGVLVTALDPERLVHVFRSIRVGERSTVGIMDREGKLYVWSASTDPIPAGLSAPAVPRSATTSAAPANTHRTMRDLVDDNSVVAIAAIPGSDLVAFAALPVDRMLADQRRYARTIVGFALLTLLATTLPIVLVAARALREVTRRERLEVGIEAERQSARTDALTGAANRRAFEDALARCHRDLVEDQRPFTLAMIDVDRFKLLNDTRGHVVGDRALQRIALTLMDGVRSTDLVARLGGDEFAILMPRAGARSMRRPFDAMFTALTVAMAREGWPISVSVGVIAFEGPIESAEDATHLTDRLMYAVKGGGRNGVRYAVYRDGRLHPAPGPSEPAEVL
jgi:diguanylate cyclase (GGDEF)-like protein